ncbi:MAG: histidine phosphatase family protein [Chloroflexi bacterium]|nr:histidine phosphatase family protein [Chloroflexota bacterium]
MPESHDGSHETPTRLILVRHGASHHKEDGIVGGPRGCRGLTEAGRDQAARLARRLLGELQHGPSVIYCSVLPRAIETAEILGEVLVPVRIIQDCGLCTWHTPPDADGRPWTEYRREHSLPGGGVFRPFERGNESWSEMVGRTGRALEQIAARHWRETVVVVAHAETIPSSLIVFGGLPLAIGFDLSIAPTSITEWATEGNPAAWPRPRWTLMRLNDRGHLTQEITYHRSERLP